MDRSYGWVVVAAGIAITCLGMGGVLALGVFLPPLEAAEGWTRTQVATASMFAFLAMGVAGFGWGTLSDRWGTRPVGCCISRVSASTSSTRPTCRRSCAS